MQNIYTAPGRHTLMPLPYSYNALEPVIGKETVRIHHDIHQKSYVENLNKAELKEVTARDTNDYDNIKCILKDIAFNGSGVILHNMYWLNTGPADSKTAVMPFTEELINKNFGSFDNFKNEFIQSTSKIEGSGWGILAWQPSWQRLIILGCEKHQNITQWNCVPVLVCDVWEHAYYLNYQADRLKYINEWFGIINWKEVDKRLTFLIKNM